AMVDTALLGFGEVGNDNPLPLSSPASYTHDAPKRDLAKAKQLLAEAGHPDGISVDLYTAEAIPGMVKMAQAYAEMAREAGINVNVIVTPADSYWDNIWLKKPFLTSGWNMRPPGEALSYAYTQKATYKETHWERPDYDQILLKAAQTPDQAERNKTYAEASRILAEEGGVMIPMFVHQVIGVRKGCAGYTPRAQAYKGRLAEFTCAK